MSNVYGSLIDELIESGAHKATKIMGEKRTVVATRRLFGGKPDRRVLEVGITDGPPNYENRERIKKCKKMGMAFPLRIVRLDFAPKKKR